MSILVVARSGRPRQAVLDERVRHLQIDLALQVLEQLPQLREALVLDAAYLDLFAGESAGHLLASLVDVSEAVLSFIYLLLQSFHFLLQSVEVVLVRLRPSFLHEDLFECSFQLRYDDLLLLNDFVQLSLLLLLSLHSEQLFLLAQLRTVLRLQFLLLGRQLFQLQGDLLKLLFEAVIGEPVPPKIQAVLMRGGIAILMGLTIFLVVYDVIRLFQ